MKKILPLFSYVFHPLFIPLYGALFYLYGHDNYYEPIIKYVVIAQIILLTILIPVTFVYFLKVIGKVDSIMIANGEQRKIPLIVQLFLMGTLLLKSITFENFPELFFFFLGGVAATLMALLFLYFKIKASIHMIGMISLTSFIIGLSFLDRSNQMLLITFLFLMNGVVGTSRLAMKAHSQKELILGFAIGLVPQLILWQFWL